MMNIGDTFRTALKHVTYAEVATLAELLEVPLPRSRSLFIGRSMQDKLWTALSYYGSNNIAYLLRGNEGVDYPEIVRDVCRSQKIKNIREHNTLAAVIHNERVLIRELFNDMWKHLSDEERRALLESLGMSEVDLGAGAAIAMQFVAKLGGFGTYQLAVIMANAVGRALLGQSLSFGANAALTRGISVLIGPVGWIGSGAWLLYDMASPARRKTLPAVVMVAALRELSQRLVLGVMGEGSTGKDTLLKVAFGIDTKEASPIPGQTDDVTFYPFDKAVPTAYVANFPGFGDLRKAVQNRALEHGKSCSLLIYLIDRIPQKAEIEHYEQFVMTAEGPSIACFNKWDKVDDEDREVTLAETKRRLKRDDVLCMCIKESKDRKLFGQSVRALWNRIDQICVENKWRPIFQPPDQ